METGAEDEAGAVEGAATGEGDVTPVLGRDTAVELDAATAGPPPATNADVDDAAEILDGTASGGPEEVTPMAVALVLRGSEPLSVAAAPVKTPTPVLVDTEVDAEVWPLLLDAGALALVAVVAAAAEGSVEGEGRGRGSGEGRGKPERDLIIAGAVVTVTAEVAVAAAAD